MSKQDNRQDVIEALERLVTPGITLPALADSLGLGKRDYARLRATLLDLIEEGLVRIASRGAFALAPRGRPADRRPKASTGPVATTVAAPAPAAAPRERSEELGKRVRRSSKKERVEPTPQSQLPWKDSSKAPSPTSSPDGPRPPTPTAADKARATRSVHQPFAEGRITVHPAGYGFLATEDGRDVFIPAKYRGTSLDGDLVRVSTWPGVKGTEGRVEQVVTRGRARLTGVVRRSGRSVWLEPDDPRIAADYGRVSLDSPISASEGVVVVVEITRYPQEGASELAARVVKVLGEPGDPGTEIEKILACAGIPIEFPDDAIAQAEATPAELGARDLADRIDLRDRRFCTIDPETARDFDDALCIEDGPHGGPRVWVAVADVSHYVRWGDALDREAVLRGVSVYLPDRMIPMLPLRLASGVCSLNPNLDRCAMVVRLDYSRSGELVKTGYAAAVIRSQGRLDYPGVAAALQGDFRGRREMYREWIEEIRELDRLAQVLRRGRRARGALDLDLPEPKVVLDADDPKLVRDVIRAKGDPQVKRAYELVEEFMIAANEAVGRYFRERDATTVWRVHAVPDRERVETLAGVLGAFGVRIDVDAALTPVGMNAVLEQVADKPSARALSFLVLRALSQAVWDTVPIGHFGLASGDYLHFTSPIRRYPDLLVHRLLKYHLHREGQASGGGYAAPPPAEARLAELSKLSSVHERRAMEAEREAVSMYRTYLVRDQIGESFSGVVSAVTSFGVFVELDNPYVEGLIKYDALGDESFAFDDVQLRATGRRTGKTIALGDQVTVEIIDVSVGQRRISLKWLAGGRTVPVMAVGEPDALGARERPFGRRRRAGQVLDRVQVEEAQRRTRGPRAERVERVERGGRKGGGGGKAGGRISLRVSHRGQPTKGRSKR